MASEREEKIKQLTDEIERLNKQVSELKKQAKINWKRYRAFGNGKYGNEPLTCGDCYGVSGGLRAVVLRLLSLGEKVDENGKLIAKNIRTVKAVELTEKEAEIANGFLDEIYPFVEKYAIQAMKLNKSYVEAPPEQLGLLGDDGKITNHTKIRACCNLSERSLRALERSGIATVWGVLSLTDDEILRLRNVGQTSFLEIKSLQKELRDKMNDEHQQNGNN